MLTQRSAHDSDTPLCPETCPIRITDVAWHARVIPLSRGRHIRGYQPVRLGHPSVPFESLHERNTIAAFAAFPGVSITAQPFTIYYEAAGVERSYTPDLLVEFAEVPYGLSVLGYEATFVVECKPEGRVAADAEQLELAGRVMSLWGEYPFVLMLEADVAALSAMEVRNAA